MKTGVVSLGDTQLVGGRDDNHHNDVVDQNILPALFSGDSSMFQLAPSSRSEGKLTRGDDSRDTIPSDVEFKYEFKYDK